MSVLLKRSISRICSALATAVALNIGLLGPASAAAPPPIGRWMTADKSEQLVVNSNATCGFFFQGKLKVSGSCSWQASSAGGILTITYPMPLEPGKVRYNIVWVNNSTIRVWGDVMHKVG